MQIQFLIFPKLYEILCALSIVDLALYGDELAMPRVFLAKPAGVVAT